METSEISYDTLTIDAAFAIIGLSGAGKTTFLERVKNPEQNIITTTLPTMGLNVESLKIHDSMLIAYDLGGQEVFATTLWEPHLRKCDGAIFILDAADPDRIQLAQNWLQKAHEWIPQESVFCFIANKKDLPECIDLKEVIRLLNLSNYVIQRPRSFGIYHTSALTGEGVDDAWSWFSQKVLQLKATQKVLLQNVFLFTEFGQPLATTTLGESDIDSSFISGFFSALNSFGSQFLSEDKGVADITFGTNRIIFENRGELICACIADRDSKTSKIRFLARKIVDWGSITKGLNDDLLYEFLIKNFSDDVPSLKKQDSAPIRIAFAFSQKKSAMRINELIEHTNLPEDTLTQSLENMLAQGVIEKKRGGWYVPTGQEDWVIPES